MDIENLLIEQFENLTLDNTPTPIQLNYNSNTTISRNGDLLYHRYPNINFGHHMIKSVEVQLDGQTIDTHYGDWLFMWNELSHKNNIDNNREYNIDNNMEYNIDNNIDNQNVNMISYVRPINELNINCTDRYDRNYDGFDVG